MGLPWPTRTLQNKDHGHALEGTAFQGVSVFVIPRSIPGVPRGVAPRSASRSRVRTRRTPPSAESRWRDSWWSGPWRPRPS